MRGTPALWRLWQPRYPWTSLGPVALRPRLATGLPKSRHEFAIDGAAVKDWKREPHHSCGNYEEECDL
jgi:hypothetical protein